jgi:hypothetical protein
MIAEGRVIDRVSWVRRGSASIAIGPWVARELGKIILVIVFAVVIEIGRIMRSRIIVTVVSRHPGEGL